jgi:adenylosuccinate lyase
MKDKYVSPLCERYADEKMQKIFSPDNRYSTWRKLWVALAESEKQLGLNITDAQIEELKAHIYDIDYEKEAEYESKLRHDVMAHIYAYGDVCPDARAIIHLGATSCYVTDNADILLMREGLCEIRTLLVNAIAAVSDFAEKYKGLPILAYTHFQAAQPTTLGKRATLWLNDLVEDLKRLDFELGNLKFFGCKGTTGTGASFLQLFDDEEKVFALEKLIAEKFGFTEVVPVSGQTYSRKIDAYVLDVLSDIAQSAAKFSSDIRLMCHMKEVDEPFETKQIGSSAMAYKKNPMRSERVASLARYVMIDALNPAITEAQQWLERTLDDSANKRISVPEAFLATSGILNLYINVISGLRVYDKVIKKNLDRELPFMATENILMYLVEEKGFDRQVAHEKIRVHSIAAGEHVKVEGGDNDLLSRLIGDKELGLTAEEIEKICDAHGFCGLAEKQTEIFLAKVRKDVLEKNSDLLGVEAQVKV